MLIIVDNQEQAENMRRWQLPSANVLTANGLLFKAATHELRLDEHNLLELYSDDQQQERLEAIADFAKYTDRIVFAFAPTTAAELNAWYIATRCRISPEKTVRVAMAAFTRQAFENGLSAPRPINPELARWEHCRRTTERYFAWHFSRLLQSQYQLPLKITRQLLGAVMLLNARQRARDTFLQKQTYTLRYRLANLPEMAIAKLEGITRGAVLTTIKRAEELAAHQRFVCNGTTTIEHELSPPVPLTFLSAVTLAATENIEDAAKELLQLYNMGLITYPITTEPTYNTHWFTTIDNYITSKGLKTAPDSSGGDKSRSAICATDSASKGPEGLYELIRLHGIASCLPSAVIDRTQLDLETVKAVTTTGRKLKVVAPLHEQVSQVGWLSVYPEKKPAAAELQQLFELGEKYNAEAVEVVENRANPENWYQITELLGSLLENELASVHDLPPLARLLQSYKLATVKGAELKATDTALELAREFNKRGVDLSWLQELQEKITPATPADEVWPGLKVAIDEKLAELVSNPLVESAPCPRCKKPMARHLSEDGSFEPFWACPDKRFCRTTLRDLNGRPVQHPGDPNCPCPLCGGPLQRRRREMAPGEFMAYWSCTRWQEGCKVYLADIDGQPEPGHKCPKCNTYQLKRRSGNYGAYFSCSGYPHCNGRFEDDKGVPVLTPKKKAEKQAKAKRG